VAYELELDADGWAEIDAVLAAVGRRKSRTPVILRIDAAAAARAGVAFYAGNDRVWLADTISPEFISGETG
jgi:putative RNA 2'-phosphotransferase